MKRVLVTTVKRGRPVEESGAVYIYDWDAKKIVYKMGMQHVYARIPRNPRGGIRGMRGAFVDERKRRIYVASNDTITTLNYKLEPVHAFSHPLFCNLHDIKPFKDGILVASCGNDAILFYRPYDGDVIPLVHSEELNSAYDYRLVDRHGSLRPNSLAVDKNNCFYVVFATKDYINKYAMEIKGTFSNASLCKYDLTKGITPHNMLFLESGDKEFYYCSSEDSKLYKYSSTTTEDKVVYCDDDRPLFNWASYKDTKWGWLRGLDGVWGVEKNTLVVGSSPYARIIKTGFCKPEVVALSDDKHESVYSVCLFKKDWQ